MSANAEYTKAIVLDIGKMSIPGATGDDVWLLIAIPVALVLVLRLFGPGLWRHPVALLIGLLIACAAKAGGEAFQAMKWTTLFMVEAGALALLLMREEWVSERVNQVLDRIAGRASGGNGSGGT